MFTDVHHVCFVVYNLENAITKMKDKYGLSVYKRILIKDRKMEAVLFKTGGSYLEIISPISKESELNMFLKKNGEGFHHIAYEVESIREFIDFSEKDSIKKVRNSSLGDWKLADFNELHNSGIKIQITERLR